MLICDPDLIERLKAERQRLGLDKRDEIWDGDYVMSPLPNVDHQWIVTELAAIFRTICRSRGNGRSFAGLNVSDRGEGWTQNYREPDVAVYLDGNSAKDWGTHWEGGPDFAVEVLSPGDPARRKRDFYAKVNVREFMIVDRSPWSLELYRANAGRLDLVGKATVDGAEVLASEVLPLTFRLIPGQERPRIEVARTDEGETWAI
ncbi:Uma2 family endonuclease [Tundrisphaera sp. TA3]|uniref:Uma2 family endonuclease n=1 Tax=Tundrisphaera sp. TA3 TaxID=3435775 RepID=UPI003EB9D0DE